MPGDPCSSDEHMNLYTIFQCAQLLERFSALQRTGFPLHKLQKRARAEIHRCPDGGETRMTDARIGIFAD